jgi:hypothetical protein
MNKKQEIKMDELTMRRKFNEGIKFYRSLLDNGYNPYRKEMVELRKTLQALVDTGRVTR